MRVGAAVAMEEVVVVLEEEAMAVAGTAEVDLVEVGMVVEEAVMAEAGGEEEAAEADMEVAVADMVEVEEGMGVEDMVVEEVVTVLLHPSANKFPSRAAVKYPKQ